MTEIEVFLVYENILDTIGSLL